MRTTVDQAPYLLQDARRRAVERAASAALEVVAQDIRRLTAALAPR